MKNVRCLFTIAGLTILLRQNDLYEALLTLVPTSGLKTQREAELQHFDDGPYILVECREFIVTKSYRLGLFRRLQVAGTS